ncbi:MAG TPA: ABC transporter permease [Gemmataceae bacterium]|nr:ABC transporter permease [Gemmataceae bacterium]
MNRWHSVLQLFLARVREFYREPEVLFWVYGFPVLLAVCLGIAFLRRTPQPSVVDVQDVPELKADAAAVLQQLQAAGLSAELHDEADCAQRLRTGRTALVVIPTPYGCRYIYDPAREESILARSQVNESILRWKAGIHVDEAPNSTSDQEDDKVETWKSPTATWQIVDSFTKDPGNRYIDFLMPGLMGMNLMGGGLWGVGFLIVDMRVRKLLKRLLATPMRRGDFLLSILGARMVFVLPEMLSLLLVARLGFGVPIQGSFAALFTVIFLGAFAFAGIGLLVACRAQKTETASGLMNLVMLPMWVLSGIFFSSKRFPEIVQPFIQALPLTQLNQALREVMLEGATLTHISNRLIVLAAWAVVSFLLALRWFRWQ